MKTLNLFLLTLFLFTATFIQTHAQPSSPTDFQTTQLDTEGNDYALLIRNFNHLQAAIKTVDMMTEDDPNAVNNFEVIICGKKLTDINDYKSLVKKAQNKGLTLTACGMTMDNFSMDKEDLPDGVQVEANGLIRIFELQEQGYKTITL